MKETLIVVTDLAGFKAFRLDNDYGHRTPRLELFQQFGNADAHTRLVEKVTDLSGRFPRSGGVLQTANAMSDGERHNLELELRKRYVRQLAGRRRPLLPRRGSKDESAALGRTRIPGPSQDRNEPFRRPHQSEQG